LRQLVNFSIPSPFAVVKSSWGQLSRPINECMQGRSDHREIPQRLVMCLLPVPFRALSSQTCQHRGCGAGHFYFYSSLRLRVYFTGHFMINTPRGVLCLICFCLNAAYLHRRILRVDPGINCIPATFLENKAFLHQFSELGHRKSLATFDAIPIPATPFIPHARDRVHIRHHGVKQTGAPIETQVCDTSQDKSGNNTKLSYSN
jgi:hypothetical protein